MLGERNLAETTPGWINPSPRDINGAMSHRFTLAASLALPLALALACSGQSTSSGDTSSSSSSSGTSGSPDDDGGPTSSSGTSGASSSGTSGTSGSSGSTGTLPSSTNVTILVYPNGNHASELIAAINGAKTSVYMTMYEIDDKGIIDAIIARKNAGLDVQVVLDGSTTTKSNNTSAYNSFTGAGIPTVYSSAAYTYTHEKCVMIDHAQAWIMTANAESSVPAVNREFLAIDNDAADVAEAEAIFNADHGMKAIAPTGNLIVANSNARVDLVALVNSATTTLDIEDEEFSDNNSNGITNAVVAAAKRGVAVRVIVAGGDNSATQTTALADVKAAGGSVYVSDVTSGNGSPSDPYIHAKAILVDCANNTCTRGFVGSENLTTGSLQYNREVGVIITDATQVGVVYKAVSGDIANPNNSKL